MDRVKRVFGFGGTGYLAFRHIKELNYHGKARVWDIGTTKLYRPQSFYYDIVHILGTGTFSILKNKIIYIN